MLKFLFSNNQMVVDKINKAIKDVEKILKLIWEQE